MFEEDALTLSQRTGVVKQQYNDNNEPIDLRGFACVIFYEASISIQKRIPFFLRCQQNMINNNNIMIHNMYCILCVFCLCCVCVITFAFSIYVCLYVFKYVCMHICL